MKKHSNVIPFPKEQSLRARLIERGASQKSVLALSILSVLILSVFSNQLLTRQAEQAANRGLASMGPVTPEELKWEHNLARDLSQRKGLAAHLAVKPSVHDELIFGDLQGRYAARLSGGKVAALEVIRHDEKGDPLAIKDRANLLIKHRSAFAVPFSEVSLVSRKGSEEVWNLIGADKTIVGTASVRMDADGRLTSLTLK